MIRTPRRATRVAGYVLLAITGALAMVWPSPTVAAVTGPLVFVWAGFLVVGGAVAAWGAATDRWLGEYTGLPLLFVVCVIYALIVLVPGRLPSLTAAALLLGVAAVLGARWQDVAALRRALDDAAGRDDP